MNRNPDESLAWLLGMSPMHEALTSVLREYVEVFSGDPTRALVFLAIAQAVSVGLQVRNGEATAEAVTFARISRTIGVSPETVRRHMTALIAEGRLSRCTGGGVLLLAENVEDPAICRAIERSREATIRYGRRIVSGEMVPDQTAAACCL